MSSDLPTLPSPGEPGRSRTPWLVALAALAVVILVAVGVVLIGRSGGDGSITISDGGPKPVSRDSAGASAGIEVDGDPLPAFSDGTVDRAIGTSIPTIVGTDYAGHPVTIKPGSPMLIVVMAHWCPHCQAEIPRIVEWNRDGHVPDGLDVVGVSTAVDQAKGNYPPSAWLEREKWPFRVLADDAQNSALAALGVNSFPTLVAVGADGRVAMRATGEGDVHRFDDLVTAAMDGAAIPSGGATVPTTGPAPASSGRTPCPAVDGSSKKQQTFDTAFKMCIDPAKTYTANVETSMGAFTIAFDPKLAPNTVNNFVSLARYHYYDGMTFHRVIAGFMIQGGDPDGTGAGGPGYEFNDELPAAGDYQKYSVAMANSGPDTNGSQFFIISGPDGVALPPSYSLFGKVTAGTDVIDAIQSVPTQNDDQPSTPVVIKSIEIVEG